jgi:hypothetical protein
MRFNKENLKAHIVQRMQDLEKIWNFDPTNGYSQVINSDINRIMAYGEYQALDYLWSDIEYNNIGEIEYEPI